MHGFYKKKQIFEADFLINNFELVLSYRKYRSSYQFFMKIVYHL